MNQSKCKHTVRVLLGFTIFFSLLFVINFAISLPTIFFFFGLLIGVILGVFSSFILVRTYNIMSGEPKDPQSFLNKGGAGIGIILGAITVSIVTHYFDKEAQDFVGGAVFAWLIYILAFFAYYRCKQESKLNNHDK